MAKEIEREDLPRVLELLQKVLGVDSYKIIKRMGGLTNRTYYVMIENGEEYIVRIPGEGTEELIVRKDEKKCTKLACDLGIDADLVFFGDDGSKVTKYLENAVTMSAETLHEEIYIEQIAQIFKKLHSCGVDTKVPFEVFDMATGYEKIIYDKNVNMYDDYQEIKETVMKIKKEIDTVQKIEKVPCHNDALCENWIDSDGHMYLIDWEYAGMNDGMWDLADVSIEANYDEIHDTMLLSKYLGKEPSVSDKKHFMANKIYVDYLWTLWAKARVPYDGQSMEDWAFERYARLKNNIQIIKNIQEEK